MKNAYKDDSFGARLDGAAQAKQKTLARIRDLSGPGDPAFEERLAARRALTAEREARRAERQAARDAEARALKAQEDERRLAGEAARKATRDARYAARKARQT